MSEDQKTKSISQLEDRFVLESESGNESYITFSRFSFAKPADLSSGINALLRKDCAGDQLLGRLQLFKQSARTNKYILGPIEVFSAIGPGESLEVSITEFREVTTDTTRTDSQDNSTKHSESQQHVNDYTTRLTKAYNSSISAKVSASNGFVSGGLSATTSKNEIDERIKKEIDTLAQEAEVSMRQSTQIMTRRAARDTVEESTRRMIENKDTTKAINIGIRRVFREIELTTSEEAVLPCWVVKINRNKLQFPMPLIFESEKLPQANDKNTETKKDKVVSHLWQRPLQYDPIDSVITNTSKTNTVWKNNRLPIRDYDIKQVFPVVQTGDQSPYTMTISPGKFTIENISMDFNSNIRNAKGDSIKEDNITSLITVEIDWPQGMNDRPHDFSVSSARYDDSTKSIAITVDVNPNKDTNKTLQKESTQGGATLPIHYNEGYFYAGNHSNGSNGSWHPQPKYTNVKIKNVFLSYLQDESSTGSSPELASTNDLYDYWLKKLIELRKECDIRNDEDLREEEKSIALDYVLKNVVPGSTYTEKRDNLYNNFITSRAFVFSDFELKSPLENTALSGKHYPQECSDRMLRDAWLQGWTAIQWDADEERNKIINSDNVYIAIPFSAKQVDAVSKLIPTVKNTDINGAEAAENRGTINDRYGEEMKNLIGEPKPFNHRTTIKVPVSGFIYDVLE